MSSIRDIDLAGGGEAGSITQSVVKGPFMLRTGQEYLRADYPDAIEFPTGLTPLSVEQNITMINPLSTEQGVYTGRDGELIIQVSNTDTNARFQISVDAGVSWAQIATPAIHNINSFWRFDIAKDGQTIYGGWYNNNNAVTHTANIISYDNGATFVDGIHTALVNAGVIYSGSTVLAAAFSADSQTMYVATEFNGILKSERTSGVFSSFTVLVDLRNFNTSAGTGVKTFEKLYVVEDVEISDPAYGNIIFSHRDGVIVVDSAGNVLVDEVSNKADGPSIYKYGVFISAEYYSVDGGLSVRNHNQDLGTFAITESNELHDIYLNENKLLVGYFIDEQFRDNGEFGATFNGSETTEVIPAIDCTSRVTIKNALGNYSVLAGLEKDAVKFYVPYISNTVGPRGESLNLVRV